jgi:hypothetical protein
MELVQSGVVTIAGELDLELHLILRDGLAAHRAGAPTPGPPQVRSGRRDGSFPVRITSRAFARRTVSSGMATLQGPAGWSCQMPGGPDACSRHPGSPMEDKCQSTPYWDSGPIPGPWLGHEREEACDWPRLGPTGCLRRRPRRRSRGPAALQLPTACYLKKRLEPLGFPNHEAVGVKVDRH